MIRFKTALPRLRYLLTTGLTALALLTSAQTHAESGYLGVWSNTYPGSASENNSGCQICHAASTQNLNPYGAAFCNANGSTQQRIVAAENADSDNDPTNTSNIGEINADAQPGWTTTAVPTFSRGSCNPTGNTENTPNSVSGDLDPQPVVNDPNIAVAPTNLNFGTVVVGNSNTVSTTIQNSGTATLTVTGLNLSGSNEFSLANNTPNLPFNVGAGNSQNIGVVYTPVDSGTDNGSLAINSNDPDQSTVTVSLNGTGNVPQPDVCDYSVAPTALAFGNVETGTNSTLSTTVTNNGTATCSMTANVASGSGQFNLASNTSFNVGPGNSADVTVEFTPQNLGGDSGTLNLASDDAINPQSSNVALTGNGVAPPPPNACSFTATPDALAFGNVTTNTTATRLTTVSNNGTANCSIAATVASGSGQFVLASGSPVNLVPGASASVFVEFTPVAEGADSGTLNLNSNDPNNVQSVPVGLTGNGVAPQADACDFTATPASLVFGGVMVGNSSTLSTSVTNNGTAACSIAASVSGSADFDLASGSPVNVAPGASASVSVSYAPSAAGADSGNLNLNSSDANNPQDVNVPLSGNGVDNVPPPVGNCEGLDIDRASWSNRRDRLRVEGDEGQRNAGDFVLLNAFSMAVLATGGSEDDDEEFDFRVRNLDPVPCVVRVEQPGSGRCAIADVSNAPDDCGPGALPPANIPPTADPNGPYTGTAGQPVSFDGSGSSDPDGAIASYAWDFGDGGTGTGVNPSHTYATAGNYIVSLTVVDNAGASSAAVTTTASISDAPVPAACGGELDIDRASWSNRRDRLRVDGDGGQRNAGDFVLLNAITLSILANGGSEDDDEEFEFRVRNLDPVPCVVRVEQPGSGRCAIADVSNAPADCER